MNVMKRIRIFLALAMPVLAVSCVKTIPYDGDDSSPMLVVNAVAGTGMTTSVNVSRSRFFLDSSDETTYITDANVTVSINGESRKATYLSDYGCNADLRSVSPGDLVEIQVNHPIYGNATARELVPQPSALKMTKSVTVPETDSQDSTWTIGLKIDAPEHKDGQPHYYRLSLNAVVETDIPIDMEYYQYPADAPMTATFWLPTAISTSTAIKMGLVSDLELVEDFADDYAGDYSGDEFLFDDDMIGADDIIEIKVTTHPSSWFDYFSDDSIQSPVNPRNVCRITLETLTESTYKYIMSTRDYDESDWSLFQEPVTIIGNIVGALGSFCCSSTDYLEIRP